MGWVRKLHLIHAKNPISSSKAHFVASQLSNEFLSNEKLQIMLTIFREGFQFLSSWNWGAIRNEQFMVNDIDGDLWKTEIEYKFCSICLQSLYCTGNTMVKFVHNCWLGSYQNAPVFGAEDERSRSGGSRIAGRWQVIGWFLIREQQVAVWETRVTVDEACLAGFKRLMSRFGALCHALWSIRNRLDATPPHQLDCSSHASALD